MKKILTTLLLLTSLLFAEKPLTDSLIQGRLNIVNGYSSECVMHKFFIDSGWTRIEGEVGRNGIDGLYYKKKSGVIKEVLIAESKWNTSKLGKSGKNKLIKQMSQQWILRTLNKLQKYKPLPEYNAIKKLVKHNQYRARLFRMFPKSNNKIEIHVYQIKNKGSNDYDLEILKKLEAITMGEPKNSFQKRVLKAYNTCRAETLQRYFPLIKKSEIIALLEDNYLQKQDISRYSQKW